MIIKKKQGKKNITQLNVIDNNKYKFEKICNSAIYAIKLEISHLSEL